MQTALTDALDRLRHCATDEDRWVCAADLLRNCGSEWITVGTAVRSTGAAIAIRSTSPPALMRDYMAQRLYEHDPWMKYCAAGNGPDHIDVAAELRAPTRPDKARVSRLFADHGVRQAVLVPAYGGSRSGGIVLYACDNDAAKALDHPDNLGLARLMVALVAAEYRPEGDRSRSPELYSAQNPLTLREREVLRWVYAGLRTNRIAERMGLKDVPVTKHLLSIRRKLQAQTREQALAIAVRDGFIQV